MEKMKEIERQKQIIAAYEKKDQVQEDLIRSQRETMQTQAKIMSNQEKIIKSMEARLQKFENLEPNQKTDIQ